VSKKTKEIKHRSDTNDEVIMEKYKGKGKDYNVKEGLLIGFNLFLDHSSFAC
jgi:hypothetical protein